MAKSSAIGLFLAPRGFFMRLASFSSLMLGGYLAYQAFIGRADKVWIAFFLVYLLLRGPTWIRWYRAAGLLGPRAGIEDHFDKASVIGMCLGIPAALAVWFSGWAWIGYLVLLALSFFIVWNGVLLVFHFRDEDPMTPNALSGGTRHF